MSSKYHDFRPNSWTKTLISPILTTSTPPPPPCHAWLGSYGSHLQFGTKLSRLEGSYKLSEFLGHVSLIWDLVTSCWKFYSKTEVVIFSSCLNNTDELVISLHTWKFWKNSPRQTCEVAAIHLKQKKLTIQGRKSKYLSLISKIFVWCIDPSCTVVK